LVKKTATFDKQRKKKKFDASDWDKRKARKFHTGTYDRQKKDGLRGETETSLLLKRSGGA